MPAKSFSSQKNMAERERIELLRSGDFATLCGDLH